MAMNPIVIPPERNWLISGRISGVIANKSVKENNDSGKGTTVPKEAEIDLRDDNNINEEQDVCDRKGQEGGRTPKEQVDARFAIAADQ